LQGCREDCGRDVKWYSFENRCDDKECVAIGEKLGKTCEIVFSDCVEILDEKGAEEGGGIVSVPLVFEFKDGTLTRNYYYRFSQGTWEWSSDGDKWVDKNVKTSSDFINKMKTSSYLDGVMLLIKRTIGNNEGGYFGDTMLSTERVDLTNSGIFIVNKESFPLPDFEIYFRYLGTNKKIWEWSLNKKEWKGFTEVEFNGIKLPSKYLFAIDSLKGKNFYNGARIIFETFK